MKLLVGLGNPGEKYDKTYHNMGFWVVSEFAKKHNVELTQKKFDALTGAMVVNGEKILIALPQTFMNLSGRSVLGIKTFHKIQNKDIFVVTDDIDLPLGTVRFREKGSGGTHNGMRDIVEKIGQDFPRIKMGVGKPENCALVDFVLQKISKAKLEVLGPSVENAVKMLEEKLGCGEGNV